MGVVANLTIYLGAVVIFPHGEISININYISLAWINYFIRLLCINNNINMIKWILASAIFGLCSLLVGEFKLILGKY